MDDLPIGLRGLMAHRVCSEDLATNWKNDVPVMATPVLLWLAELVAMRAIDGHLPDDTMCVGYSHEMTHLAPTPAGWSIQFTAKLVEQDGALLTFEVEAHDDDELVLRGRHVRAVIDKARFLRRVEKKASRTIVPVSGHA